MKRGLTLNTTRSIDADGNTILKGTFSIKIYGVVIHSGGYLKKTITTEGKATTTETFQINDSTSVTAVTAHNGKLTITENINGNITNYEGEGKLNYSMIGNVCAQAVSDYASKVSEIEQLAIVDNIYPITIDGTEYRILDMRSQQHHTIFILELGFGIQLPPECEELQTLNINQYPKSLVEVVILAIKEIKTALQGTTTPIILDETTNTIISHGVGEGLQPIPIVAIQGAQQSRTTHNKHVISIGVHNYEVIEATAPNGNKVLCIEELKLIIDTGSSLPPSCVATPSIRENIINKGNLRDVGDLPIIQKHTLKIHDRQYTVQEQIVDGQRVFTVKGTKVKFTTESPHPFRELSDLHLKLAQKLKSTSSEEVTKDDESSTLATAPSLAYETDGEELTWTMAAAAPPTTNPAPTAIEEMATAEPVAAPPTPPPSSSISGAMPDTTHDTSNG